MQVVLLSLLIADAGFADSLHAGVGLGVGGGYDVAGARVELGIDRLSLLLGFGMVAAAHDAGHALAAGARWSLLRPESGPSIGAHVLAFRAPARTPWQSSESIVALSATFTWRWRKGPVYLDLGAGPAVVLDAFRFPQFDYGPSNGYLDRTWTPFIDLDVGCGFAF